MKRETQRNTNPFPFSDTNKRYHTFDYYLRSMFGAKTAKISLDAGFTCPNIDGTVGCGGCIYCSGGSSGAAAEGSLRLQYEKGKEIMERKWGCKNFIPYLQAHTNTYAPIETLERVYRECVYFEGAVMLAIATRADCLDDEVISLLKRINCDIPVMVELGLQSIHDETAVRIGRGHSFAQFRDGYKRLRDADSGIKIGVHLINGLPLETKAEMLESAAAVGEMKPDIIKFHLLHVLKNTRLASLFESGEYVPMELEDYVETVCDQLESIPPEIAVGRVTGDGKAAELLAPLWSIKKTIVANEIDKELFARNSWQGKKM
ncbi:MAG: TIGR01212 family radical SAM protein [Ruminococcaceae bacterium]|nr:TIGR01212 family radical SAM protein [Oscillospiraceae bacterium]